MANPSANKTILLILAVFVVLALAAIYINLKPAEEPTKFNAPVEELDTEATIGENAVAFNDPEFETSPIIESFILLNHRGAASQLDMQQPAQDTLFEKQDRETGIQFTGSFPVAEDQIKLRIKLYSNDEAAFNEGKALFTKEIETQNNKDGIPAFTTSLNLDLSPGLYYYILETTEDELLIGGGKFKIVS